MTLRITLTAAFNPDQTRNLGGAEGGQWTAQPPTPAEQAAAGDDEQAKQMFLALLGMNPQQQADYLKGLSPDKLHRLGMFAYLGSGDKQITAIRTAIAGEMTGRGMNPVSVGATPTKGKGSAKKSAGSKAPAAGSSKGSSSKSSSSSSTPKVTTSTAPTVKKSTKTSTAVAPATTPAPPTTPEVPTAPDVAVPVRASATPRVSITIGEKR